MDDYPDIHKNTSNDTLHSVHFLKLLLLKTSFRSIVIENNKGFELSEEKNFFPVSSFSLNLK